MMQSARYKDGETVTTQNKAESHETKSTFAGYAVAYCGKMPKAVWNRWQPPMMMRAQTTHYHQRVF